MSEIEETYTARLATRGIVPGAIVKDNALDGTFMRVTRVDEKERRVHFVYLHSGIESSYNEEQVSRYMELANESAVQP